jgi:hypothetical protein
MSWFVAGLIGGVVAYVADWVMWSKVVGKGTEPFATAPPAGQPINMGPMMIKSAALALVYGVLFALTYHQLMHNLWTASGWLGGMELATTLWIPVALACIGGGVWYDRARPLMNAQMWAWLVRMNAAGAVVGLLVK